jgi:putative methionine-R-sulfoxide reductase with GAF domain
MKKFNVNNILLLIFLLIALGVFIFGIRELVVLNSSHKEHKTALKISETSSLLNEIYFRFYADNKITERIILNDSKSDLANLIAEHNENTAVINSLFNEISLLLNDSLYDKISAINHLNNYSKTLYTQNYLPIIQKLSAQKTNLLNQEISFSENNQSSLKQNLQTELFETDKAYKKTRDLIINNFINSRQKIKESLTEKELSVQERYTKTENISFLFFLSLILFSGIGLAFLIKTLSRPLLQINEHLDIITKGELPEDINVKSSIEIVNIGDKINETVKGLKRVVEFSTEIGNGNFDAEYEILGDNDILGISLLSLRDNLLSAQKEEEKRKKEDSQRNRTNEALTKFSEILRQQTESISELASKIISELVKFLDANQGGLFFLNEEDKTNIHYELLGSYAYSRKRYITKQIKPGEGLVGAVAIEKYTVYMTNVPDEYIEIESGFGSANPRYILIVPLKIEEDVLGVIELASFNTIEKYEIEMVEKIAETIASSLANARINIQTSSLLKKSKEQDLIIQEQEALINEYIKEIRDLNKKLNA